MSTRINGFADDALGVDDAVGVTQRIKSGDLHPSEAVEAAIARVERVDPTLGAVAHRAYERARNTARPIRKGDARPFAGVPSFVKDNNDVVGMPCRHGSKAIDDSPATSTNAPAAQFMAQGYVVLGKSTMPEFGLTASTEFADGTATRNPWNSDFSVGASSGGSAALVASGAVPIAQANDGGGSIRIPAAANGLVGLKTTRGRTLDRPGARQLPVNLSAEGVVTRSVRDTAHHLAALERTYANKKLPSVGRIEGPSNRRLRIGVARCSPSGIAVDPITMADTQATADLLGDLGHHIDEVTLPTGRHFVNDFGLYWGFMAQLMTSAMRVDHRGHFDPDKLDPITKGLMAKWRSEWLHTPRAIRRLRAARADYDAMFATHDLVLSPTLNHPTPRIGELDPRLGFDELFERMTNFVGFTPVNNICGGPAIVLPTALDERGLPGSVHFSAGWGDEATLLELAFEIEAARPFPRVDI